MSDGFEQDEEGSERGIDFLLRGGFRVELIAVRMSAPAQRRREEEDEQFEDGEVG